MDDDAAVLTALRAGDEEAFTALVEREQSAMLRVALCHCRNRAAAEEAVQDTWLAVLRGLARFEGRSSLRTWIFSILLNRAKTQGVREKRASSAAPLDDQEPAVDPGRFAPAGARWPGHWSHPPQSHGAGPERRVLDAELRGTIETAIQALPSAQRTVMSLRDIEGLPADVVCNALGLTETNQRVILHRARSRVRLAVERYLDGEPHA